MSSPPLLLPEANCAYLPTLFTRPRWRPARWRTCNNQEKKIPSQVSKCTKDSMSWVCFTWPTTWRVRRQLVVHCKWCFGKDEKKFIAMHFHHWNGMTHLPRNHTGAPSPWKHPECRNLARRCNNLLKVFAKSPALPSGHSSFTIGWYSLKRNVRRRSHVLPCCGGSTHQLVRGSSHRLRVAEALQVLCTFPFLGDNIVPDSKCKCPPPQLLLQVCFHTLNCLPF